MPDSTLQLRFDNSAKQEKLKTFVLQIKIQLPILSVIVLAKQFPRSFV